jgi:hypothetical protein
MKKIFLFISAFILFCSLYPADIETILKQAGDNRLELEKILDYYSRNPEDSLKLRAAEFLIANMDVHFSVASPDLDVYYKNLDSIFSLNERSKNITKEQDSLFRTLKHPNTFRFQYIFDVKIITADFLIDNIEQAFEAWQSPFAKNMNFDDFCEFLLPYKSGYEKPAYWRSFYRDSIYPYVQHFLDTVCYPDNGLLPLALQGNADYKIENNAASVEFNENSYLSVQQTMPDTSGFTISAWIHPNENRLHSRFFDFGKNDTYYMCFVPFGSKNRSKLQLKIDSRKLDIETDSLPAGQWSHVAVSFYKNCFSLYVNGIFIGKEYVEFNFKEFTDYYIGKSHYSDNPLFYGKIKDFRIYSRRLNNKEIYTLAGKKEKPMTPEDVLQNILWNVNDLYRVKIIHNTVFYGGNEPLLLLNIKQGLCYDYSLLATYIFRSLGIPSGIDFTPQWANRSMGHDWNTVFDSKSRMMDYSMGAHGEILGEHLENKGSKKSKVFRESYAKQPDTPGMYKDEEEVPDLFWNPLIKDVSDKYLDCADITVPVKIAPPETKKFFYLCNFNNREWIPIHWGRIAEKQGIFTKMGKDVAYMPMYYDNGLLLPASDPFILTKEEKIIYLTPDTLNTQTMILKRKYTAKNVAGRGKKLSGGKFQVANKPDFSDSITVYTIKDTPEVCYNRVNLNLNETYGYFRFLAPKGSAGGEIAELEIYNNEGLKLQGTITGNGDCYRGFGLKNVFDGNPLSYYRSRHPDSGEVGLDFGKPASILYFRFLPRNDDNFIHEGEEYELFYWDRQWISLGRKTGTDLQYLEYTNAPGNALFWLHNHTKGKEERIFTYENGEQVWW